MRDESDVGGEDEGSHELTMGVCVRGTAISQAGDGGGDTEERKRREAIIDNIDDISEGSSTYTSNTKSNCSGSSEPSFPPAPPPHESIHGKSVYDTPLPSDSDGSSSEVSQSHRPKPHEAVYGKSVYDTFVSGMKMWDSSFSECSSTGSCEEDTPRSLGSASEILSDRQTENRSGDLIGSIQDATANGGLNGSAAMEYVDSAVSDEKTTATDHKSVSLSASGEDDTRIEELTEERLSSGPLSSEGRTNFVCSDERTSMTTVEALIDQSSKAEHWSKLRKKATSICLCLLAVGILISFLLCLMAWISTLRKHLDPLGNNRTEQEDESGIRFEGEITRDSSAKSVASVIDTAHVFRNKNSAKTTGTEDTSEDELSDESQSRGAEPLINCDASSEFLDNVGSLSVATHFGLEEPRSRGAYEGGDKVEVEGTEPKDAGDSKATHFKASFGALSCSTCSYPPFVPRNRNAVSFGDFMHSETVAHYISERLAIAVNARVEANGVEAAAIMGRAQNMLQQAVINE